MTRYRVLTWQRIPMAVKVFEDGQRALSAELPAWFSEHVDRVAMRDAGTGPTPTSTPSSGRSSSRGTAPRARC